MSNPPSAVGLAVPDLSLPATGGGFRLSDHRGRPVVLYFYPKDSTPGCTLEAQQFRDLHDEFARLGCAVFGISRDSLRSHENFRTKQCLPFELLVDADERACRMFDVIRMKNMYGKQVLGIQRSTFLIDREGRLAREWRGVKADGHAAEVLAAVKALS
jgi:thioredoxin-dependent peroxiredoxin